jgi:glycerol-3-phosphate acyltransferase PlsY
VHYVFVAGAVVLAYFLGTFPSAIIVARANGVDVTAAGSGNPGASNVTRLLGWKKGVWVYVFDASKGVLAVVVGRIVAGDVGGYLCAAGALLGHVFPVTRGFRGGKGVATGSGAMMVLQPAISAVLTVLWFAVIKFTKKASLASLAVTIALPIGMVIAGSPAWEVLAMIGLGALVVIRHLPNLRRLRSGSEHTLRHDAP